TTTSSWAMSSSFAVTADGCSHTICRLMNRPSDTWRRCHLQYDWSFLSCRGVLMSVRRGRATVRLSAGLLLTAACALGPAAAQAAPVPADNGSGSGGQCESDASPSVSASSVTAGESVTVTGTCFVPHESGKVSIFQEGDNGSRASTTAQTNGNGTIVATLETSEPGDYMIDIKVDQQQATGSFTASDPDPEPSPDPEPTP